MLSARPGGRFGRWLAVFATVTNENPSWHRLKETGEGFDYSQPLAEKKSQSAKRVVTAIENRSGKSENCRSSHREGLKKAGRMSPGTPEKMKKIEEYRLRLACI
ncbi:hypothetical protein [Serratia sp. AKBS12]|uniref:hypothetical protein n=1 Tax=Serratia sp. AKBS12 TaxID=2974597 RepID=UPI0021667FDD|nr:hypothetical protein [Serratia sp. AKBS12]MCS3407650.1 hypothetical protein [Serratia sp. AKBS12]